MSKSLIDKIKNDPSVQQPGLPEVAKNSENPAALAEDKKVEKNTGQKAMSEKLRNQSVPVKKREEKPVATADVFDSIEQLHTFLKDEKRDFHIKNRVVYIDDDIADVLDLLRKKGKISAGALTSYLLKEFFLKHRHVLEALKEKKDKDNKFLD